MCHPAHVPQPTPSPSHPGYRDHRCRPRGPRRRSRAPLRRGKCWRCRRGPRIHREKGGVVRLDMVKEEERKRRKSPLVIVIVVVGVLG